ncbi:MAG: NAD(P)-binding protein [Halieaceae bacterium]|jgi:spermidine dehydrogenase|nr:NAD(P)-binding protein [Halieaceae bacterium]
MSKISRRDFVNGTLVAAGASMLPLGASCNAVLNKFGVVSYPPALTRLRGSHLGSNSHAHARAWGKKEDWGTSTALNETYDLIVVGGGISGLAAAYFYQQAHGIDKRILILDNHDDFGGHAKRNEHTVEGKLLLAHGGSQSIVDPKEASQAVSDLFKGVGVDVELFNTAYDKGFYKRHNLGAVTYFNKAVFGEDKVVRHPYCNYPNYVEGLRWGEKLSNEEAARQAPLSEKGREQLLGVLNGGLHKLAIPEAEIEDYISSHSYFDYLKNTLGVDDPGVLRMARSSCLDWESTGADLIDIEEAKKAGAMGFAPKAVYDKDNPYIYHFPDGNAGVARALVKKMIPGVAVGNNAEELVLSKFQYAELDKPDNAVGIRLDSTVVNVQHNGDPDNATAVIVDYIKDNKPYQITGKNVVMACYNMMIPHIVPDLPEEQEAALRQQSKSPLQYTSVGLKNWRALKEMEIGMAMSPGNIHQTLYMDFPVSMGGYKYTATPDDPCVIQMISCPYGDTIGAPAIEQYREARYKMLGLQFNDYEQELRTHLGGMLPKALFDFDKDVESITINRWGHGYTVPGPGDSVEIGRQPFGRITIANCDSGSESDAKTAIDMAARAVEELG